MEDEEIIIMAVVQLNGNTALMMLYNRYLSAFSNEYIIRAKMAAAQLTAAITKYITKMYVNIR